MPDVVLPYLKAWAALIGAILVGVSAVVELPKALTVVLAILTAVSVFSVPNTPPPANPPIEDPDQDGA